MSFGIYVVGYLIVIGGLTYGAVPMFQPTGEEVQLDVAVTPPPVMTAVSEPANTLPATARLEGVTPACDSE